MNYIIINKDTLEKRIEELEKERLLELKDDFYDTLYLGEINALKQILSQSTPLIPEIEKGVREGLSLCLRKKDWAYGISGSVKQDIKNYISNLKLDI